MISNEWYWVAVIAAVGGSFLWGRWCGIRAYEKALKDKFFNDEEN